MFSKIVTLRRAIAIAILCVIASYLVVLFGIFEPSFTPRRYRIPTSSRNAKGRGTLVRRLLDSPQTVRSTVGDIQIEDAWIEKAVEIPRLRHWVSSDRLGWYQLCVLVDYSSANDLPEEERDLLLVLRKAGHVGIARVDRRRILYYYDQNQVAPPNTQYEFSVRKEWHDRVLGEFVLGPAELP